MRMEQMYQELILEHYKHPHGRGLREPYQIEVQHVNPTCGDEITLRVQVTADVVTDISYDGQGCSISQASISVLYDQVVGLDIKQAMVTLDEFNAMMTSRGTLTGSEDLIGDGIAFAGVSKYPARVKCALLGWLAFKDALLQALDVTAIPENSVLSATSKVE